MDKIKDHSDLEEIITTQKIKIVELIGILENTL